MATTPTSLDQGPILLGYAASPCVLAIPIPLTVVAAVGAASGQGALVRLTGDNTRTATALAVKPA
ncbi:hypothetical protein LWC34_46345 [Kibdelosporangium philippinense]|uniref:Uncharacterized protein n=1 Tax=Kibdelosporangium philippinense TaxID=211113 RepID=A0ABS8ZR18_9PSEU|nr:hypothetical protein [Kibdelosporangium philippinense]MCE7010176.1 hypothetical protein [Kibdelosporangium philippinense]